jgi:hypothetical protein
VEEVVEVGILGIGGGEDGLEKARPRGSSRIISSLYFELAGVECSAGEVGRIRVCM